MSAETEALWWSAAISGVAILVAPALALFIQRQIDRSRAANDRKQQLFKALWVNRRRPFWVARVDALNMIDVEFKGEKAVQDAWLDLFAHYRDKHPGIPDAQIAQDREEKYSTLLYEISKVLGYSFPRAYVRDNIYLPELHGEIDQIEFETRKMFLQLLKSDALRVELVKHTMPAQPANTISAAPPSDA